ncbi:hypothetical protein SAMN02787142_8156 [Burkholderia sp. WP9]|uniref:hypothetical protein n=1 Tax=Burkholderia sp. WP9 TaxID=1500263 RepID=UPI000898EC7A|nr:hypothetical protein [Burkholderia sp. WP9]SEF13984.1 hypothetical protein SAMN02787142_8156 [Burkholderia sp. WP9]
MAKLPGDAERFSKLAAGFQSIILSIAVVVGGAWTIYTFWSLNQAQLAQLQAQLQKLDFEQRQAVRPVLQVAIEASLLDATVDDYFSNTLEPKRQLFIQAKVSIANAGNLPTIIDLEKNSLRVSRINSGSNNVPFQTGPRFFDVLGAENKIKNLLLAPANKTELQYLVDVQHPGIHTLEFQIPLDPASYAGMKDKAAAATGPPATVRAVTFVYVSPQFFLKRD